MPPPKLPPAPQPKLSSTPSTQAANSEPSTQTAAPEEILIQSEPLIYSVRRGDSLTTIAKRYGIGVEDILLFNPMDDPDLLVPGQTLRIPQKPKAR